MTVHTRSHILDRIGQELDAPVLAYVTGDRPGMETQVAVDVVPRMRRHLKAIGHQERIALLIHTRGGDTNAPWPMINTVRAHCEHLTVLVPYFAHSAGTLLTLGADQILMTRYSTLSPIDPTVANAFNPQDPADAAVRLPIAVEDVMAFLELADKAGDSSAKAEAFRRLAESVHPLALGNVQRSINQIRQLAQKMIRLAGAKASEAQVQTMIDRLTTQSYSHSHQLTRREALDIGLPIGETSAQVEELMLDYYDELCTDLELMVKFDPPALLRSAAPVSAPVGAPVPPAGEPGTAVQGSAPVPTVSVPPAVLVRNERGYLETASTCDAYVTAGTVSYQMVNQPSMPPGFPQPIPQQAVAFEIVFDQWEQVV